jgi:hypothetical protein
MAAPSVAVIARRVDRSSMRLSTTALQRMEQTLPWFVALSPEVRAAVGLLVQSGIRAFADWLRHPDQADHITAEVFASAPGEMARLVTLQQTVELVRVAVEVTEEALSELGEPGDQSRLREAALRFSREIAFAAALVYARAAEQRGAWDARLEYLVVDGVVRGEVSENLLSRAAALGWSQHAQVAVVAGDTGDATDPERVVEDVHARGAAAGASVLAAVQSHRLVAVVGSGTRLARAVRSVVPAYGTGPVVTGPVVGSLAEAGRSARAAFSGLRAVAGWPDAPRPVASEALLPERALQGDDEARAELVESVYVALATRDDDLLATVDAYLGCGASVEATARKLFVHANTVRYRLGRAAQVCGRDLYDPRERYVAQVGLVLGRLDQQPGGL